MKSKRICFVATLPITLRTFVLPQTLVLIRKGWEVTWISSNGQEIREHLPSNVRFIESPIIRGVDLFGLPKAIFQLHGIFRKEEFSIVQYSTPNAAFVASTAAFFARVPVRLYAQWGIRYVGFSGFLRWFFKQFERWVCFCSTVIEPDSKSNLYFSVEEGLYKKSKGRVIGHGSACGVDLNRFDYRKKHVWREEFRKDLALTERDIVIGFVGSVRRDKGVNELLAACRKLFAQRSDARLLLIGDKTFYEDLDRHLRDWAESSEKVIFVPPTRDVPQYMACIDIFCLPSYREGFGMVVIEAEAMGVPVVVSDIPGPVDAMVNGKTGYVVKVRCIDELAEAINRLLEDKVLRENFGNNAHHFAVEHFEQQAFLRLQLEDKESLLLS